jgi:hypothetical protein
MKGVAASTLKYDIVNSTFLVGETFAMPLEVLKEKSH